MPGTALLYIAFGMIAGAALPLQAAINSQLARTLGHPVFGATVSFGAGLVALLALTALNQSAFAGRAAAGAVPAYAWVAGGVLGVTYIIASIFLTPRLGTAAMISLAVSGQLLGALALDQVGAFGLAPRPIDLGRVVGALLLLGGVALITRR